MHGGASESGIGASCISGLSPHARGSPAADHTTHIRVGSIPACTGEPQSETWVRLVSSVYPRMHGGARQQDGFQIALQGLSPHARGSRNQCQVDNP